MRCYTMIVSRYGPIMTLLHSFRHEDMLLFRLKVYRGYAYCFESTSSNFKLTLNASYPVSEVLLNLIQGKLLQQTIHN